MTRDAAQKAIDDGFAEGLRMLFTVLERNIVQQGTETASREFETGVGKYDAAHTAASAVIERIFSEAVA